MVLEKILETPLDCKDIKPVNPMENNLDYSLEVLMLKFQYSGLITHWKDPDLGKVEGKRRRLAEDDMVR